LIYIIENKFYFKTLGDSSSQPNSRPEASPGEKEVISFQGF